jgi:ATP-dependent DNA helicase 2 subunit 1
MDKFFVDLLKLADDEAVDAADPVQCLDDLLRVVRKRVHKKRSLGRITFDLGNDVKIAVSTYNLVQKAYKPSKVRLALDTNEEVRTQRTFVNPASGAPLLYSDISKYQEYGGKKIKFTQDETKNVVLMEGEVGLQLCGFKPRSFLKWGQFVRSGYFLYPEENTIRGSRQLFAALLIKCLEREVVAICTYKPRHNSGPSFVALVPQAEEKDADGMQVNPSGFHLQFLPFADDVRQVPDVSLKEMDPEQVAAAEQVVRNVRMNYRPEMFENPDLQAHYTLIEALALQRDDVKLVRLFVMSHLPSFKFHLALPFS